MTKGRRKLVQMCVENVTFRRQHAETVARLRQEQCQHHRHAEIVARARQQQAEATIQHQQGAERVRQCRQ